ncbi:MAG: tRNA (cytidine(56)-2'-O)-methyltransferase [Candidatus Thermoplasmatota archaeon]|nr:tRNA (cytidine(56)-2'-O)-methyltransferase [Candidatus Thermoplasmatota archaeon]
MPRLVVLRMGHRLVRDQRMTTHVALTARAFGADEVWVDREDHDLEARVADVVARFGGPFGVRTGVSPKGSLRRWEGTVVHLTMYGEPLDETLPRIPRDRDLLLVVGSEKVPGDLFEKAGFNVAVGNQPHSEVAALAVFLDRWLQGDGLKKRFEGRLQVQPSPRGKVVTTQTSEDPPA